MAEPVRTSSLLAGHVWRVRSERLPVEGWLDVPADAREHGLVCLYCRREARVLAQGWGLGELLDCRRATPSVDTRPCRR